MAGPRFRMKGFQEWPLLVDALPTPKIQKMYEDGFSGVYTEPEESEALRAEVTASGGSMDGGAIATSIGIAESSAGKLVIPFVHVLELLQSVFPGAAQERGDCVAHNEKNACLLTICCEIIAGLPDEVSLRVEGLPPLTPEAIKQGAFSTEWFYWWRGYNGDGWSCDASARVAIKHGVMARAKYDDLGIDLTSYSGSLAGKYGSRTPPESLDAVGRAHAIRTVTQIKTFEQLRDFLANGNGVGSCGSEGFSSTRDANGVSQRKGGWAHAMALLGVDDREETKKLYDGPLVLVMNSWGRWNSGPRTIRGTNVQIPEGAFWARWKDVQNRYMVAHAGFNGWKRQQLPDYGFSLAG